MKKTILILLCLLVAGAAWFFWLRGGGVSAKKSAVNSSTTATISASATNNLATAGKNGKASTVSTNRFAFRLSNTKKSLEELIHDQRAILLQNALIDTAAGTAGLNIPDNLKSKGDPGAYIVQSRGPISAAFRQALMAAGGQIVSYIPNNAYLVQMPASSAGMLSANALVQAVLPYEPYYKLQPSLLALAAPDEPLPPGTGLTVGLFASNAASTEAQLIADGYVPVGAPDQSPFGPIRHLIPPATNWTVAASLPGVQYMGKAYLRIPANDLARVTLGISTDTITPTNWLNLSGSNVTVEVNDSGIDSVHPDFTANGTAANGPSGATRVTGDVASSLTDANGHGTHVAGVIAGNGSASLGKTFTPSINYGGVLEALNFGSVSNADFRGKAPVAKLFSVGSVYNGNISDMYLQGEPIQAKALISNNSWVYGGDSEYDLAAASYDAATRDALPFQSGAQPVLFVFAAGDDGSGSSDGTGGNADSILSPGTAKNVITVGALEQLRNITNLVTTVVDGQTNLNANWALETDSSSQVADYSSRGNVGVNTEGPFGRFKPDVVAPGTFVVSTSSGFNGQWDTNAYYNPTNISTTAFLNQTVATNALNYYNFPVVPPNAVGLSITITSNQFSIPFPTNLFIYLQLSGFPDPVGDPTAIDLTTSNNTLAVPPLTSGTIAGIQSIQNGGFNFAIGNSTNVPVNFDVTVSILTTNDDGNEEQVLEGLNGNLAPYYRFESGTSIAAPAISGTLALIQDFFTNTLKETPSPALLKAMLINGSRPTGSYNYAFTNGNNFQGWGLPNIENSVPLVSLDPTNLTFGNNSPLFFVDQSVTNALATGQSHTYIVNINTNSDSAAPFLLMQATLVWTDPPGNPAAAIKLVNGLDLVITNLDTGEVFFGNDISPQQNFNQPWNTNGPANIDIINNVQNIILSPVAEQTQELGSRYSVTVVGRQVNVNAVTEQTNNVVQDYALVVSIGDGGEVPNAITSVTDEAITNLTFDQDITFVGTTNAVLFNQFVGANIPFQGTNTVPLGSDTVWGTNGALTLGVTNQWHFYVITNDALDPSGNSGDVTNAAFITFDAFELSVPRMGVYEEADPANATRPEADIDLFATTNSALTNLDAVTISNCLAHVDNSSASIGQAGTEYVFFTNSHPGQVYYIGVKSEDQMASEYDFLPVFTATPFSQLLPNGDEQVNGLLLPAYVPDGSPARPGITNVFALAIYPMQIENVVVTNLNQHQNFGDLIGTLTFSGVSAVLNNHDGLGNTYATTIPLVYDDSANPTPGSRTNDGPGSLNAYQGKSALGPWMLTEIDNSLTMTGQVSQFSLVITPHHDLHQPGVVVTIQPGSWFIDFVTVTPGFTNLTFFATNLPPTVAQPPLQMYEKFNGEPTLSDFDFSALLTNTLAGSGAYPTGTDPGNSITVGPPLALGNYFIGIFNPSLQPQQVLIAASLGIDAAAIQPFNYTSTGSQPILPDAVTIPPGIFVGATQLVESVNVGITVSAPQIADMTFTLVSPTGQRILLMENRGGNTTNGAGSYFVFTNVLNSSATGGSAANTNVLTVPGSSEIIPINFNFFDQPDEMTVYDGTNPATFYLGSPDLLLDTGFISTPGGQAITNVVTRPGFTNVTIIMNQFGNPGDTNGDAWNYTAGAALTNFEYLTFTDDTNLTDIPIKYAIPPFDMPSGGTNFVLTDFGLATNGLYTAPTNINDGFGGWTLPTNIITVTTVLNPTNGLFQPVTNVLTLSNNFVSVVTDPLNAVGGSNFVALAKGTITRSIPTIPGTKYSVTFWYRGPGISSWWRGEGNASDSSDPENNANNGRLVGQFNFPAGEVGQAFEFENHGDEFEFAGTNSYVQIPQSTSLDVGKGSGFTVEGWINPTNLLQPQPLVEWLAKVPTNAAVTNLVIKAGPYLNLATGHYYYLLGATDWITSEQWAISLGGHLATIDTANEQNWVYDNFANFSGFNHNLWLGLTNNAGAGFGWSSGLTNFTYVNWLAGQPDNSCGSAPQYYTGMLGGTNAQPGLWVLAADNGVTCTSPLTNRFYGVAEVDTIQTNGVRFWISATNTPGTTNQAFVNSNGCLYANIVDTNFVSHEIFSAPGLLQSNIFQHVALTYNTNNGQAILYLNGTNVASTNLGVFVPKTDGDVLLGRDLSAYTNNYYGGLMDEMSVYHRTLSAAEILSIYQASALTTNRNAGKFDPAVTPVYGLAEAQVIFGNSSTNILYGVNDQWELNSFTFTATTNSMPLQITGLEPGILLDDFSISETSVTNVYYLPEQSLTALTGTSAFGNWTLQVWDNLTDTAVTSLSQLLSWQLSFVLQSNATVSATILPETTNSSTIPPGQIVYFQVNVPSWAQTATNVLVSSTEPVNVFFNPTILPTGSNPNDIELLTGSTGAGFGGANQPIAVNSLAPFTGYQAGTTYFIGIQNPTATAASVLFEVDYNITPLTNDVPISTSLNTNDTERYFSYTVGTNAYETTFQLLKLSGNADLVVSKGTPLPTLTNTDYGSFNNGNVDENIYVLTNSSPVPLSPGVWYVGVIKRDSGVVNYTVVAKELDVTGAVTNAVSLINLTNGVPFNWTAGPGAALTNFFVFSVTNPVVAGVTNYVQGVHFELYNLTGNGDLTVQTNALPLAPPFFQSSQNPQRNPESILVFTNGGLTNLAANWYLGVPNNEASNIDYTILAWVETNSYFPAFPGASGSGGGSAGAGHVGVNSTVYHVTSTADSGPSTLRDAINATNRTVVFDLSGTINLLSPLIITNSYLTIAGQTAPGGGVTVIGSVTTVANVHDVVIRDVRFRPNGAIVWDNGFEGYTNFVTVSAGGYFDGWLVDSGNIEIITNGYTGSAAYQGNDYIDLNGNEPGTISTNIPTVAGQQYILNFAYTRNPYSITVEHVVPTASVLVNSNDVINLTASMANSWTSLDWQIATVRFTATSSSTPLTFEATSSGGSGVLLDAVNLTLDTGSGDSLQFLNVSNVVADHISASWATSNLVSVLNSSNVTMQWSILSDSLHAAGTDSGYGSLLRYGSGALSFNHNLYADNYNGSPRLGDNLSLDFVNNVIYNWGIQPGFSGTNDDATVNPGGFTNQLNYSCNYLIAGIDTSIFATNLAITNIAFVGGTTNTWIFQTNNFIDSNTNTVLDGADTKWAMFTNQFTEFGHAFPLVPVPTDEAYQAYEKVLDFAGVNMDKRDPVDTNIVDKVRSYTGRIINVPPTSPALNSILPYLDTDQDGIPDFWEVTFGEPPYVPSNNDPSPNAPGYTTLEEYNNWLAGPHAVTITNTPVGVDLQQLFGESGHLSFFVTNNIHGLVYLTNVLGSVTNVGPLSNSIAVFTPTNNAATNYSGYASFDVYVTNTDTVAYFGPVTVSVIVSPVAITIDSNFPPVINPLTPLINPLIASPVTAFIDPTNFGGSDFYEFVVTNNGGQKPISILFDVTNASGPVILVARYGLPLPSLSSYDYISTNSWTTSENIFVTTNTTPVPITNGDWYLAVVNVAGSNVTYNIGVTEKFNILLPPIFTFPTNTDVFTAIETFPFSLTSVATDPNTPPATLTFALINGPTNLTVSPGGVIDWTPTLLQGPTTNGPATNSVSVSVSNGGFIVTNTFTIVVDSSNVPPVFVTPNPPNQLVILPDSLLVTNAATNLNLPPVYPLIYTLPGAPAGASIDSNGVISWAPTLAQVGSYLFTTVVTDTNPWAANATSLSITNSFFVTVESPVVIGQPQTNTVAPGATNWIIINVPTNAIAATNTLLFATNLPVNVWFSTNVPPTITPNGVELLSNATNGISVLTLNSTPAHIVPGGTYFLGVQNTNSVSVTYALQVNFRFIIPPITISSIVYTNIGGTNGYLLTWFAPSNDLFQVQWKTNLLSSTWNTFSDIVGYNTNVFTSPTHTQFNFFDDGSQTDGFSTMRYYQLILFSGSVSNSGLTLPSQPNLVTGVFTPIVVTNTATDSNPGVTLTYRLVNPPAGALISTNGIITWTPPTSATNAPATFTTIVTDNGTPSLSATNSFTITVLSVPDISSQTFTTNGYLLTWFAPSNELFQVEWKTNLLSSTWNTFSNIIGYNVSDFTSPTHTEFQFLDNGSQDGGLSIPHFYQLILLSTPVSGSNSSGLTLPPQANLVDGVNMPIAVTNTATDSNPGVTLTYTLVNPPAGALISINGIIIWTPTTSATNAPATFTTIVTDNGTPPLSATNSFTVTVLPIPNISSQSFTTNGYLLTWFAPSNELFQVEWKTNLLSSTWNTFTNIISYNVSDFTSPTHTEFQFLDNGSQDGGLSIPHFYQLIFLNSPVSGSSGSGLILPAQSNLVTGVYTPIVVTNTATDSNPGVTLIYTLVSPPTGALINATNGIITWTPTTSATNSPGAFTTIVRDNSTPPLSATNSFTITVLSAPAISSQTFTTNGYLLTWFAPSNELFQIEWKTNLLSSTWNTFSNIIGYNVSDFTSSTHTEFQFLDNGLQDGGLSTPHFYQLILLSQPVAVVSAAPLPSISSVVATPSGTTLKWVASTNDQFHVLWATNIIPPIVWNPFPVTITSTNGTFFFTDTNASLMMKFYELMLLP